MSPRRIKFLLRVAITNLAVAVALLFWTWLVLTGLTWIARNHPYLCVAAVLLILAAAVGSLEDPSAKY